MPASASSHRTPFLVIGFGLLLAVTSVAAVSQSKRDVAMTARKYAFLIAGADKAELKVDQDDLVRITLVSEDIPHSFTLPEYRIQKRVEPGREVTFEFRADRTGRFEFHCSLTNDRCRERGMVGTLTVTPRSR
jgi:heme/copper-type cytochrome/quinol oxidase subunit 2